MPREHIFSFVHAWHQIFLAIYSYDSEVFFRFKESLYSIRGWNIEGKHFIISKLPDSCPFYVISAWNCTISAVFCDWLTLRLRHHSNVSRGFRPTILSILDSSVSGRSLISAGCWIDSLIFKFVSLHLDQIRVKITYSYVLRLPYPMLTGQSYSRVNQNLPVKRKHGQTRKDSHQHRRYRPCRLWKVYHHWPSHLQVWWYWQKNHWKIWKRSTRGMV